MLDSNEIDVGEYTILYTFSRQKDDTYEIHDAWISNDGLMKINEFDQEVKQRFFDAIEKDLERIINE